MNKEVKPQETELKLQLPGQTAEKAVIQKLSGSGYVIGKPSILVNDDLYLDTFDWLLIKKKLALRYRCSNGQASYTLKSIGNFNQGIAQRTELEFALERPPETPQDVPVEQIRSQVTPLIFPRVLLELVRVRTRRREYPIISPEGAKISLAFDSSNFSRRRPPAVNCRRNFYEMEAELKEGDVSALVCLQKLMTVAFDYPFSSESKLQRAIGLLHLVPVSRKTNPDLSVKLADPLGIALQKIIAAEFQWFHEQLPGVIADLDSEFVHQARVTTRRMRSAIKVFNESINQDTGAFLADELKWLGGLFGAVRDIDVYVINLNIFEQKIDFFPGSIHRELEKGIEKLRSKPFKTLLDGLGSARYVKFERRLMRFIESPPGKAGNRSAAAQTIRQFAPEVINRDFDAVNGRGREVIAKPDMKQFHLLRIEMKKLRYATEFMAPAYGDALASFIRRTVEIQDCLGELQDTVFTREFSQRIIKDWKRMPYDLNIPFVLGELFQYQANIAKEHQASFAGIWERFTHAETAQLLNQVFAGKELPEQP
ncbi:MAG TPA: CHAD domain-containing protein [Dehalococcoidales bacterium]